MRHRRHIRLGLRPAVDSDRERDYINHLGSLRDLAITHPLLAQRYPSHIMEKDDSITDGTPSPKLPNNSTPPERTLGDTNVVLSQGDYSNSAKLPVEVVDRYLLRETKDRFIPDLVTMDHDGDWPEFSKTVKWLTEKPERLMNFLKANATGVTEDEVSKRLIGLMNEVAWRLKGEEEKGSLFAFHGTRPLGDTVNGDFAPQDVNKSDLLAFQTSPIDFDGSEGVPFHKVASLGERKKRCTTDFRTDFAPGAQQDLNAIPVIQLLRGIRKVIGNNGATGRVLGFTNCETLIRLWVIDASGFASTVCCDLAKPEHAEDVVKIIAVLSGPLEDVLQTWKPSESPFETVHRGVSAEWEWVPDRTKRSFRPLHIRPQVFGRRTVIWYGMAKRKGSDDKPIPVIIKANWLPVELQGHELNVVERLDGSGDALTSQGACASLAQNEAGGDSNSVSTSDDISGRERVLTMHEVQGYIDGLDEEVKRSVPKPLGLVIQQTPLNTFFRRDHNTPDSIPRLVFTPIALNQPQGEVIDDATSTKQLFRYLGDTYQALFFASLHGVHHRDANLGNTMSWCSDSGRRISMLIDFGNATILGNRRNTQSDSLEEVQDACRSANQIYWCHAIATAQEDIDSYKGQSNAKSIAELQRLKDNFSHRYVDDMESFMYCHCHKVWITGDSGHKRKRPGHKDLQQREQFHKLLAGQTKAAWWRNGLNQLTLSTLPQTESGSKWQIAVTRLVEHLNSARQALNVKGIPEALTRSEAECFRITIMMLKQSLREDDSWAEPE